MLLLGVVVVVVMLLLLCIVLYLTHENIVSDILEPKNNVIVHTFQLCIFAFVYLCVCLWFLVLQGALDRLQFKFFKSQNQTSDGKQSGPSIEIYPCPNSLENVAFQQH